jgi:hypothetical protein
MTSTEEHAGPPGGAPVISRAREGKEPLGTSPDHELEHLIQKHEISPWFQSKLPKLEGVDVSFLVDDSGSMDEPVVDGSGRVVPGRTRFHEARDDVSVTLDVLKAIRRRGKVQLSFLNRTDRLADIYDKECVAAVFAHPPTGPTPLAKRLGPVLFHRPTTGKTRHLTVIVTDGEPDDKLALEGVLASRSCPSASPVSILLCTDDEDVVRYWNTLDKRFPCLDVVDDYISERAQIRAVQGPNFCYSRGDHWIKGLLGPLDKEVDELDERVPAAHISSSSQSRCGQKRQSAPSDDAGLNLAVTFALLLIVFLVFARDLLSSCCS